MSATTASVTSTPLLKFALLPIPDPPQAGEKLTLRFVASKPHQTSQVFCDTITFRFDVDASPCTRPSCLATASGQQTVMPLEWDDLDPHDPGVFAFLPKGKDEVTQSYTFDIFEIDVSTIVGTATVTVTEHSTDHDAAHCPNDDHDECYENRIVSFNVPKFPAGFGGVDFKADRTAVPPGSDVTLSWQVEKVASYQLLEDDDPIDPAKITRTTIGDVTTWSFKAEGLDDDTVFTLKVGYDVAEAKLRREYYVPVNVQRPTLNLLVVGNRIMIRSGEAVTLKFDVAHVTECALYAEVADGVPHLVAPIAGLTSFNVKPAHTTEYYLGAKNANGEGLSSSTRKIFVVPSAPAMGADLLFIKTAHTDGVVVELHFADGAGGYQATTTLTTNFDVTQGPNGSWTMIQDIGGWGVHGLVFIKTRNTDGLMTEFHHASPSHGKYELGMDAIMPLSEPDAAHGTVLMANLGSEQYRHLEAPPDLLFIKTANTRGSVEVRRPSEGLWRQYADQTWPSVYPVTEGPNGTWLMADMAGYGGQLDLVFIKTANTSGNVELSYATGASGYQRMGKRWETGFDAADAANGTWLLADMDSDGLLELVFVKTANTVSGRVEVYYASAGDGFRRQTGGYTAFDIADGSNGTWQLVPAGSR